MQRLKASGTIFTSGSRAGTINDLVVAVDAICAACPEMAAALLFKCAVEITISGSVVTMQTKYPVSLLVDHEGNYWNVLEIKPKK